MTIAGSPAPAPENAYIRTGYGRGKHGVRVHIHGVLAGVGPTPPTALLAVSMDVAGRFEDLAVLAAILAVGVVRVIVAAGRSVTQIAG